MKILLLHGICGLFLKNILDILEIIFKYILEISYSTFTKYLGAIGKMVWECFSKIFRIFLD